MYWASASFIAKNKRISNKVIIENIDKSPKNVTFINEEDEKIAKSYNGKFKKDWQDLNYIVDVEVLYIQGVPKTYKILKLYVDEIYD
ncbi:MAG: hypothetical protein LBM19_02680 [Holosporales bacterium]|jgi:hypothetical protein|nr:hypothetical protein [Holosporales bacterium]